jgi:type I restriction enzyme, S subunit
MTSPVYKSLSDCARSLSGGTPSKSNDSFWAGDLPWVSSGEMGQPRITDTELHITHQAGEKYSKIVPARTILVVVRGMSLAKEFRVSITQREMAFNQDLKALIAKEDVNSLFLFYSLYGRRFEICKLASESAHGTKKLDTEVLNSIPVFLPSILTQKKIAAIASTYDDLTENNDRRITLLEKMAEEIYREWFVRLRFPGHEQATFHKGIPEGWLIQPLQKIAQINMRSLTKGKEPKEINYVDIGSVTTNQINNIERINLIDAPGRARRIVKHGDTIWATVRPANRAYCLILDPIENLIVSTGFAVISPKKNIPYSFLHLATTSNVFVEHISNVAKGSAYPAAGKEDFENSEILIPPQELLSNFHSSCEPMLKHKQILAERNKILKQTRDRLLTRLISGKLSVEDLDIQFPPSMTTDS